MIWLIICIYFSIFISKTSLIFVWFHWVYFLLLVIDCGPLPTLPHGSILLESSRTTHGAQARYTCHENYTLIGHEKRTCTGNGKWSGDAPQCLFDWCPEPPQINGGVVEVNGRRAGSTATYSCKNGFILFGPAVS